jgi:hypothetical protein
VKYQLKRAKIEMATKITTAFTSLPSADAVNMLKQKDTHEVKRFRSDREVEGGDVDLAVRIRYSEMKEPRGHLQQR